MMDRREIQSRKISASASHSGYTPIIDSKYFKRKTECLFDFKFIRIFIIL